MTKRSLIHIYLIITCLVLVIGAAVGTLCHFIGGGFFNYGVEYSSGAEVTVKYSSVCYTQSGVEDICEKAFDAQGLSGYTVATYEEDDFLQYSFSYNTDKTKLENAVSAITSGLKSLSGDNYNPSTDAASYSYYNAIVSNAQAYTWCAVAAAIAIGIEAVYIVIRYRIDMGLVSLLANVNSLMLFAALLAITRIPFGSYVATIALLCVLVSMISVLLFFAKVRSNFKDEDMSKLSPEEHIAGAASNTTKKITCLCAAMAVVSVVYAIAALIATFTVTAMAPALAAVCACLACWYSSAVFTPVLYVRVRGNKAERADRKLRKNKKDKEEN